MSATRAAMIEPSRSSPMISRRAIATIVAVGGDLRQQGPREPRIDSPASKLEMTMKRATSFMLRSPVLRAAAVAVLAAGCAMRTPPASQQFTPNGTVVQVSQAGVGKVVTLHVGDTLRILLGPPLGGTVLDWQVRAYPARVLSAPLPPKVGGRVEFVAQADGRGSVVLVGLARCGAGPGPAVEGVQCPAGGDASGGPPGVVAGGGAMPSRQLTFDVVVTG